VIAKMPLLMLKTPIFHKCVGLCILPGPGRLQNQARHDLPCRLVISSDWATLGNILGGGAFPTALYTLQNSTGCAASAGFRGRSGRRVPCVNKGRNGASLFPRPGSRS